MDTKERVGHTPGPWFVFDNGHCVGGPASDEDSAFTGRETGGIAMCSMARRTPDENAANAQLISAAPELLEALTTVRDAVPASQRDEGTVYLGLTRAQYQAVESAIHKATNQGDAS